MNEDFVNYLGHRKIARANQLYYRASAIDNIIRLRIFFKKISESSVLDVGVFNWQNVRIHVTEICIQFKYTVSFYQINDV